MLLIARLALCLQPQRITQAILNKHTLQATQRLVSVVLLLSAGAGVNRVSAQTVTNPRVIEFSPSAEHNAILPDGSPTVSRYDLGFYYKGASQPFQTNSLGKPAPTSSGRISLDLTRTLTSWPLPGGMLYEARVSAVGPGGSGVSAPSNTFDFNTPCSYGLSAAQVSLGGGAGAGSVSVSTSGGCAWTTTSNATWIAVTGGSSAMGAGTAQFSVTANAATTPRTGTLTIAGQTVTVTQAGAACTYTLSSTALSLASATGTASLTVTAGTGCAWTTVSNTAWITVTGGSAGTANGTVTLSVTANSGSTGRTGTVTIAGQSVTVMQSGAPCTYTISATSVSLASAAGSASVSVTAATGCAWTALSDAAWITVTAGSTGTGNGTVMLSATGNSSSTARTGSLTIAGRTVTVTQAAASCAYTLSTAAVSVASSATTASVVSQRWRAAPGRA
jgi:hypothetical protein